MVSFDTYVVCSYYVLLHRSLACVDCLLLFRVIATLV